MLRFLKAVIGGVLLILLISLCTFAGNCAAIRQSVVRVHILANSDSEADQALKLKVRDAVTAAGAGLLGQVADTEEAKAKIEEALPLFEQAARDCVQKNGYEYPVHAELTNMVFTTRTYDAGTFPAGRYDALRITIGEGKGHNWWCLLYPPLCVSAATDSPSLSDVLTAPERKIVTSAPRYRVRFKIVEWFETLFS